MNENEAIKNLKQLLDAMEQIVGAIKIQHEMTTLLMEVQMKQYDHITTLTNLITGKKMPSMKQTDNAETDKMDKTRH